MRIPRLDATARVMAAHLAMVTVSTGLVLGFVWFSTVGQIELAVRERVISELTALGEEYETSGLGGVIRSMKLRTGRPGAEDTVYLLADTDGRRLAGNLGVWPEVLTPGSGWFEAELLRTDRESSSPILAYSLILPGGQRVLVGHDKSARAAFDRTLFQALLYALGVMALLAVITGFLLSRLVLRRIADIARTAQAFRAGDLSRRVPVKGSGDEFDRLASELNHMLDRIESLVTDLRMVTDSLAHDLRSPLTRLKAKLEAAMEGETDDQTQIAIEGAMHEGERVLAVCTSLLDIARAEAGVGREQFDRVDLAALAQDMAELYGPSAEERGLTVIADAPQPVPVRAHEQFLAQAVTNLIENAIAHASGARTIRVEARNDRRGPLLAVSDDGGGVDEEARERLTGRFVRLDEARSGGGSGLGLALVEAVARLHEGTLTLLDAKPGLRVEIRLPPPEEPRLAAERKAA